MCDFEIVFMWTFIAGDWWIYVQQSVLKTTCLCKSIPKCFDKYGVHDL